MTRSTDGETPADGATDRQNSEERRARQAAAVRGFTRIPSASVRDAAPAGMKELYAEVQEGQALIPGLKMGVGALIVQQWDPAYTATGWTLHGADLTLDMPPPPSGHCSTATTTTAVCFGSACSGIRRCSSSSSPHCTRRNRSSAATAPEQRSTRSSSTLAAASERSSPPMRRSGHGSPPMRPRTPSSPRLASA